MDQSTHEYLKQNAVNEAKKEAYNKGKTDVIRKVNGNNDYSSLGWLLFILFLASPWLYPTFFATKLFFSTLDLHSFFATALTLLTFAANAFAIYFILKKVPNYLLGVIGCMQFGFIAFSIFWYNIDKIWAGFFIFVAAAIGFTIFFVLGAMTKGRE